MTYYRYIAEQMRHFSLLRRMGWVIPKVQATPHYTKGESIWGIHWYLRNVIRHAGVPCIDLHDSKCFDDFKINISQWIQGQMNYHFSNHFRYDCFEKHLTHFTLVFFFLTALFLMLHISPLPLSLSVLLVVDPICAFLTVTLPVWAMAAHALGRYSEANRLADRSLAMEKRLKELLARAEHCETIDELDDIARITAFLMLQEVADWHIQYQMTPIMP